MEEKAGSPLQEIIDFAINKEQEAIDFYTALAGKVKNRALADELNKISGMETGHRDRLKKIDATAFASATPKKATDMKIADYLVAQEPVKGMTWQDILTIAMQRELAAMNMYTDLASRVEGTTAQGLFENLAAEESSHKRYFEQIWDDEILIWN